MTFIKYTNDGKAVIQPTALILSGLENEDALEMQTLDNVLVLHKEKMPPVEKMKTVISLMRLVNSLTATLTDTFLGSANATVTFSVSGATVSSYSYAADTNTMSIVVTDVTNTNVTLNAATTSLRFTPESASVDVSSGSGSVQFRIFGQPLQQGENIIVNVTKIDVNKFYTRHDLQLFFDTTATLNGIFQNHFCIFLGNIFIGE